MKSVIKVEDLTVKYRSETGEVHALERMTLDATEGEFVSIVGPSGCGKTTLLKVVAGLMPCTSGSVTVNGTAVRGPNANVGIVFQSALLLAWRSVLRNILLQAEIRGLDMRRAAARAQGLVNLVGLTGFESKYPHELSGGMQQRAALCRALIHDPPLLLMDEPFGALDALTRDRMNLELQRIWLEQRKTVLFVTHSISEAVFLSDRVMICTTRPASIREIVHVPLPRPRSTETLGRSEFIAMATRIRQMLTEDL